MKFKGFFSHCRDYWAPIALIACGVAIFGGSIVVGAYNKLRAKVPALPAAK
jgi:hypothetical protein